MPTDFEPDLADLSDSRGAASDPLADHKRRARWRFVGASIFCAASAGLALTILESEPRPLAQDFILRWPSAPEAGRPADEPAVLAGEPGLAAGAKSPPAKPESKSEAKAGSSNEASKAEPPKGESPKSESPKAPAVAIESAVPKSAKATPKSAPSHYVQVGAYNTRSSAETTRRKLEASGHKVSVSTVSTADGVRYRVRVGPFDAAEADSVRARAKLQGYDAILIRPESRGAR
jgi:DedD protein